MYTNRWIADWIVLGLIVQVAWSASIYSNSDTSHLNADSICSPQTETHLSSEGSQSSLTLELHPGPSPMTQYYCKRTLIAPESHGFLVRLVQTKGGKMQSGSTSAKGFRGLGFKTGNSTNSCPLNIYTSISDHLMAPWRIDPCEMGSFGDQDEQIKLLPGILRLFWDHGGNIPNYKLIVTVIGKGFACQNRNKFPCLMLGSETLLCISRDLVCDGVRHCPRGTSYDNDEHPDICSHRKNLATDIGFWEQSFEVFRNLLTTESPTTTTTIVSVAKDEKPKKNSTSTAVSGQTKTNVTRSSSIGGDLSKYGPWGYLMLGMLLCGGALLICGLWECCCRQNKSGDTNITGTTLPSATVDGEANTPNTPAPDTRPPNYEELDLPPSYSVLFPNQKSFDDANGESIATNVNSNTNAITSS